VSDLTGKIRELQMIHSRLAELEKEREILRMHMSWEDRLKEIDVEMEALRTRMRDRLCTVNGQQGHES
jgi:hypothetical protein